MPHILDLVISSDNFINEIDYLSPLGKSDHMVLHFSCNLSCTYSYSVNKCNYSKSDYDGLRNFMNWNWREELSCCDGNVDSSWSVFEVILSEGVSKYIPMSMECSWKRKDSWQRPISNNMRSLIKNKHKLWGQFCKFKNQET